MIPDLPRDPILIQLESLIRQAIRDALNRSSRKPFVWGGLQGYEQLEAIAQGLDQTQEASLESPYLALLRARVERVLAKNRTVVEDLKQAHHLLLQVAQGLDYPSSDQKVTRQQVANEINRLIQETKPSGKVQRAQIRLLNALKRRWELYGQELLYCYEIPGLPQDNLQLESLFNRLRRHQRRISGRKATRELQDFGQAQVLFIAESPQELRDQIQRVPREAYRRHRKRLAEAELPRQFFFRLHHDPLATITGLVSSYSARRLDLVKLEAPDLQEELALHTI